MSQSTAGQVTAGQIVRIEQGPKAGQQGTVESMTRCTQMGTNFEVAIIDFTDGTRSVRQAHETVTVVEPLVRYEGECPAGERGHQIVLSATTCSYCGERVA